MRRGLLTRRWGGLPRKRPLATGAAVLAFVPALSFAQATGHFGFKGASNAQAFALAGVTAVGMPFTPLSATEMSRAAAGGLPSNAPSIVSPGQGTGPVLLWDEITPIQKSAGGADSGSMSFSIVK